MRFLVSACLILASCSNRLQAEDKFSTTDPISTGKFLSAIVSSWKDAGKVTDGNSLAARERQKAISESLNTYIGKTVYYQFKVVSITPGIINVEAPNWVALPRLATARGRSSSGKSGQETTRTILLPFHGDWAIALKKGDVVYFIAVVQGFNFANGTINFIHAAAEPSKDGFTQFAGKWLVKYDNKYTHEYVISADGSLSFDRCYEPNGTPTIKKDEQKAKLDRLDGAVLVSFANGKLVERFRLEGDRLIIERFDPISLYPKMPNNKGIGVRDK